MRIVILLIISAFTVFIGSPALAQRGYSPPNTSFTATGGITVTKSMNGKLQIWNCAVTVTGRTGASVGGNPARANIINLTWAFGTFCPYVAVAPNTITSALDPGCVGLGCPNPNRSGVMNGFVMTVPSNPNTPGGGWPMVFCQAGDQRVNIQIDNNPSVQYNLNTVPGDQQIGECNLSLFLKTMPNINFNQ